MKYDAQYWVTYEADFHFLYIKTPYSFYLWEQFNRGKRKIRGEHQNEVGVEANLFQAMTHSLTKNYVSPTVWENFTKNSIY